MPSTSRSQERPARPSWCARARSARASSSELYLERIERIDPEINAYRVVLAERALTEADQADGRRAAGDERPLLGVPIAVKDNMDVAGELTTHGTGAYGEPGHSGRRGRAPPARSGRGDPRQDEPARAGDHGLHRVAQLGRHPQPLGPRAHAGRLERRQRRRGGRRPGRRRARHRRRRLDPHPRRLLRPVRAEAPARARLADARRPALARDERGRRGHPHRGGQRALPRRDQRAGGRRCAHAAAARAAVRGDGGSSAPGVLRVAMSLRAVAAGAARRRAAARGPGDGRPAALPRPPGRRGATPPTTTSATSSRRAISRGSSRTPRACRARAAAAAHARLRPAGPRDPSGGARQGPARRGAPRGAHQPRLRRPRRAAHADDGAPAGGGGRVGGHGRPAHAARDDRGSIRTPCPGTPPASPRRPCPPDSPPTACRWPCSWSAGRRTRARCSPWPRRSRPSARGPIAARRWHSLRHVREIRLHDTLSGELAPLEPREPGKVGIYACGPTVYARVHVGNARPVRGLRAAQALPRARGLRGHAGRERHGRERQDLRRRARRRACRARSWRPR